jgi:hypothetical protein
VAAGPLLRFLGPCRGEKLGISLITTRPLTEFLKSFLESPGGLLCGPLMEIVDVCVVRVAHKHTICKRSGSNDMRYAAAACSR